MINAEPVQKRPVRRFQRHISSLIWKSFKQRKRRWRLLVAEMVFASICFSVVIFLARPVFLASPVLEGGVTLSGADILLSLNKSTEISYAPDVVPYNTVMERAAEILDIEIKKAPTVDDLLQHLREKPKGSIVDPLIWVIWKQNENNVWKCSIQSTELARSHEQEGEIDANTSPSNAHYKHLNSGFLAVQLAISQAVVEQTTVKPLNYEVLLAAMPASPLMHHERVKRVLSWVLLCFTAALLLPVLETQALAVKETKCQLKRAFRMRDVDYSSMYIAWMVYGQMTMVPVCILASITLILTFRWIHFFTAFTFIFAYMCVMLMVEFIMGMFHHKVWSSCIWSAMVTILQTFIAELLIYHNYDDKHPVLVFLVNVLIPPLSLVHGFHEFALLQIGSGFAPRGAQPVVWIILSWLVMICLYFGILMLLQRTLVDAYGGAISWKSIIFKQADNHERIWRVEPVATSSWATLQEVDELMAKAVSFQNVYKSIMSVPIMTNITLDVYRGEYTNFYVDLSDKQMLTTMEDLITGLTCADRGSVNVLGQELMKNHNIMSSPHMMGYCHYFEFLVPELTVEEHIHLFAEITLWKESGDFVYEYTLLRLKTLFHDCNLTEVAHVLVKNLSIYYRAQLCWALAVLLEPRVVVVGKFKDDPDFGAVIDDKIIQNKGHLTIIKMCYNTMKLQVADRVFLLDNKCLIFGGTPPYMFYKFGRDYRIRVTVSNIGGENADTEELLKRARAAGGSVRAHHGSMVLIRMPAQPATTIAAFIRDITDNSEKYGVSSFHLSLPDTEEVFMRAVTEFRALTFKHHERMHFKREAIKKICEPNVWRRQFSHCPNIHQIAFVFRKYFSYYITNKCSLITTILLSIVSGIVIAALLTEVLNELSDDLFRTKAVTKSTVLTVESMDMTTNLIIRADESELSLSVANAYVLSEPNILKKYVQKLSYTALQHTENLANYLMIRSVDSPEEYLRLYAYGIDILNVDNKLVIQALYNPLHYDTATAARSLARAYMALIRHYTNVRHATIQIYDDPLSLDLTSNITDRWSSHDVFLLQFLKSTIRPPLFIEFMLIMTVAHATLVPSHEHAMIRHTQAHAMDFSPFRYWLTMFICDVVAMMILLSVMTSAMISVIILSIPTSHYSYLDLVITPVMLLVYGVSCIPQAYLFSLGRSPGLNTMAYVTVNLVFGETILISRYLYGHLLTFVLFAMNLSPQFNMAYGYVKIVKIFAYNSECLIFDSYRVCSSGFLHKCCPKSCGVMQECYQRKSYFSTSDGIITEICSLILTMFMFSGLLMLWEYKWLILLLNYISNNWLYNGRMDKTPTSIGMIQEIREVRAKKENLKKRKTSNPFCMCQEDTFGEVVHVDNITEKLHGEFKLRNISFGIGKGEVLALVGQTKHGRRRLCHILAGDTLPSTGKATLLNKWNVTSFKYMAHVSLSCERYSGPPWMSLRKVLEMLALFRGMPHKYVAEEAENFIEAMELHDVADMQLKNLLPLERSRANVAAALIAAPPFIILDEYVACQKFSVRRGLYHILNHLRKRGHGILLSASNVECHIPITNRLMILVNGYIYDIDYVNNLLARYSQEGFTVVVHLKNDIDVERVFSQYFDNFVINDSTDTLVNIQVLDDGLRCVDIFNKMELLHKSNTNIYTYIVCGTSIDYVYNSICLDETVVLERYPFIPFCCGCERWQTELVTPTKEMVSSLQKFEKKYNITNLDGLPWSVVFQT